MPPPPGTLPEELLEEVFLRLPPEEPAWLVRASLSSKLWLGLLTGPAFQGRYHEFHGAAPMLGFFHGERPYTESEEKKEIGPLFLSTTKFPARISSRDQGWKSCGCNALDCRHGLVVLGDLEWMPAGRLTVSDPMTGGWWNMGAPALFDSYGAAVVCALTGCDHRACHDGPFRVVFVGLESHHHTVARVWLSSPEAGECSQPPSSDFQPGEWAEAVSGFHIEDIPYIDTRCPVLVQDALHFMLVYTNNDAGEVGILKYDLSSNFLSVIAAPLDAFDACDATILMAMEDGSLGFAFVQGLNLFLWSRQLASDGEASWVEYKMVNLKELIPNLNPVIRLTLVGSVEGRDIIFVNTCLGICEINLNTLQWKKIWKREEIHSLVPYTSFYSPEPEEL